MKYFISFLLNFKIEIVQLTFKICLTVFRNAHNRYLL